jgi:F-type H+-transporting ATPase subunit delta
LPDPAADWRSIEPGDLVTADASGYASAVAVRYAQALFDLAQAAGRTAEVEADLNRFSELVEGNAELARALASPMVKAPEKLAVIRALGARLGAQDLLARFLGVLAENRRAGTLADVARAFRRLSAQARGVTSAVVTAARALTAEEQAAIATALTQALGKPVEVAARSDARLIDGLRVQIGSRLVDASLRAKLDALKSAMKGA